MWEKRKDGTDREDDTVTIREVRKKIIQVIIDSTDAEMAVTEDTHLIKELGLTSVEIMMLISDLEDRFGIDIPGTKLRNVWTVGNLCDVVISQLL